MEEKYKDHKKWNTKGGGGILGKYDIQKLGCGAMVKYLLFAVVILSVLNPAVLPNSISQSKWTTDQPETTEENSNSDHAKLALRLIAKTKHQNEDETVTTESEVSTSSSHSTENKEVTELRRPVENPSVMRIDVSIPPNHTEQEIEKMEREPIERNNISISSLHSKEKLDDREPERLVETEKPTGSDAPAQSYETKQSQETSPSMSFNELQNPGDHSMIESDEKQTTPSNEKVQESSPTTTEVTVTKSKLIYNSANPRYNICSIEGDIRIVPDTSTIFVIASTPLDPNTSTWKIKPFPRKWESHTMEGVTVMTIQQLTDANQARSCDVTHDLPAVVFSTKRFSGNLFHVYTDMIYPLFLATRRYNGEVKLVAEDYVAKYIEKYRTYLARLSHYPIINLDNETRVHCFSSVQVGTENPGPLGYKFQDSQNDHAMQQFRHFVIESLSLERSEVERGKKPRLLMLLRKHTRSIINEDDVINLAKNVGFEVVTADVETTKDFPRIARIVNSCDVLMGIHGAGLANMLYLPTNGTVLQVLPFGYLKWVGRYDYGDPPRGFGLNYVEYEITLDESTLTEKYPRDHPVLTDPASIHKKGWQAVYEIYLWEQNVKLDVSRFRGTLEEAFQLYQ